MDHARVLLRHTIPLPQRNLTRDELAMAVVTDVGALFLAYGAKAEPIAIGLQRSFRIFVRGTEEDAVLATDQGKFLVGLFGATSHEVLDVTYDFAIPKFFGPKILRDEAIIGYTPIEAHLVAAVLDVLKIPYPKVDLT